MVSVPPPPLKPFSAERSGNVTLAMPEPPAEAVAFRVNDPEPAGRNQSVVEPAL